MTSNNKEEQKDINDENQKNSESQNQDISNEKMEDESLNKEKEDESLNKEKDELNLLKEEIENLKTENSDLKNQYLMVKADTENFKKRIHREQLRAIEYANEKLIMDILPLVDDLDRAIVASLESKDFNSFYNGIDMVNKNILSRLEKNWDLKIIEALNQEFDPQKHEAYSIQESSEVDKDTVIEEFQKGYYLKDKILRTSKVKVAKSNT